MKKSERLNLLKTSISQYVIYWHHLKEHVDVLSQGYVGVARVTKYANRWAGDFKKNYSGCSVMYNAIIKYGEDNIETKILFDGLRIDEANEIEQKYRPLPHIGWNIRQGGGNRGLQSKKTKEKISNSKKSLPYQYEKIFTKETREKIRTSKLGNKNMLGKKYSEETKEKMSISAKKRGVSENTRLSRFKQVICVETGIIYKSQVEAQKETGINHKYISSSCHSKTRKAGGFTWRLLENR